MKFQLYTNRGVRHYKGTSTSNGKTRDYEMIVTQCKLLLDDGNRLTEETHGVAFSPEVWDVLAANAGPSHKVQFEGDLRTPKKFLTEDDQKAGIVNPDWTRAQVTNNRTGSTYTRGDVEFIEWILCTPGIFGDTGHFHTAAELPLMEDKNSKAAKAPKAPTL